MPGPLLAVDLEHVLRHGANLWPRLAGAHLFITGATGFFGKWLVECLLHANDRLRLSLRITALSRNPDAFVETMPHLSRHSALKWITGDVRNFDFPKGDFSHIIHAATEASAKLNRENPLAMFDTIVIGTRRVLEFAVAADVPNLLLTSSGAVYGRQPPNLERLSEDYKGGPDPSDPTSAYGEGKRAAEQLCVLFSHNYGLLPRIARCFAFIGPHLPLDAHFAAGNFLRDALAGRQIVVQGDGSPLRSYLYAADMVIWLLTILLNGKMNRPYNVGSEDAVDIATLARLVATDAPRKQEINVLGRTGGGLPERYLPEITRSRTELDLAVRIPLAEGIARSFLWLQKTQPSSALSCPMI